MRLRAGQARVLTVLGGSSEARPWVPLCRECGVSPRTIVLMVADRLIEWVGMRDVRITDLGQRKVVAEARRTQRVVVPSAAQERYLRLVRDAPGQSRYGRADVGMRCLLRGWIANRVRVVGDRQYDAMYITPAGMAALRSLEDRCGKKRGCA